MNQTMIFFINKLEVKAQLSNHVLQTAQGTRNRSSIYQNLKPLAFVKNGLKH